MNIKEIYEVFNTSNAKKYQLEIQHTYYNHSAAEVTRFALYKYSKYDVYEEFSSIYL